MSEDPSQYGSPIEWQTAFSIQFSNLDGIPRLKVQENGNSDIRHITDLQGKSQMEILDVALQVIRELVTNPIQVRHRRNSEEK